jgi:FMN phosphatase YigB (HAD superfamily)
MHMKNRIILTDCDGVLLDWESAFDEYLQARGFQMVPGGASKYNIGKRYGIDEEQGRKLIKTFNESAAIGFLPPLRDAIHYVKRLHEEHGYRFHVITSLSHDQHAQELRRINLRRLFDGTVFEKFVFLGTGDDKDQVLSQYRDTGCWWIEDKIDNCVAGRKLGLRPLLMEHEHNRDYEHPEISRVQNWREIYKRVLSAS